MSLRGCLLLFWVVLLPARALAAGEAKHCAVSYSAPAGCPSAAQMAEAVGSHFRVVPGGKPCTDCVARVNISRNPNDASDYVLQTGDESTHGSDCAELVKIAGFTVRSSHVHVDVDEPATRVPPSTTPRVELGVFAGQTFTSYRQWILGAQVGVRITDDWLLRPNGGLTPQSSVPSSLDDSGDPLALEYHGYHAGLDACRALAGWVSACAQTQIEWFRVSPNPGWVAPLASQALVGLGMTFQTNLVSDLLVGLQPSLMIAPRPAVVREPDWSATLYERPQIQLQVRATLGWGLGGSRATNGGRSNFTQSASARVTQ